MESVFFFYKQLISQGFQNDLKTPRHTTRIRTELLTEGISDEMSKTSFIKDFLIVLPLDPMGEF